MMTSFDHPRTVHRDLRGGYDGDDDPAVDAHGPSTPAPPDYQIHSPDGHSMKESIGDATTVTSTYTSGASGDVHPPSYTSALQPGAQLPPEGLQVPTRDFNIKHGFPYSKKVCNQLQMDHWTWLRLSREIVDSVSLRFKQKAKVGGKTALGLVGEGSLAALTGFFVGATIEQVGSPAYAREAARKAQEEMREEDGRPVGTLAVLLKRWNDEFFAERGIHVELDPPEPFKTLRWFEDRVEKDQLSSEEEMIWKDFVRRVDHLYHTNEEVCDSKYRFKLIFTPAVELANAGGPVELPTTEAIGARAELPASTPRFELP
ncbi:MAG: Anucleate primary sterigmata protein B [Watsoniomyces obsoletus]|nr:MAG: Anucleate primary sterigmata protein B [Watsoniomyces obsoletus]